jgi:cysteine desulfurase
MNNAVYLDYNATTPLHPLLLEFVTENISRFGNASSVHSVGRAAKKIITTSRLQVAKLLNADPLELVFTASGSEGNNTALKSLVSHLTTERNEIICSSVEHPSVLKTIEFLKTQGFKIHYLKVLATGAIDMEMLKGLLSGKTALVTVQLVNNETGNIFPLKEITELAHLNGALVHSDMVQGLGKIPIDLHNLNVDMASFAAHKFYALKGVGLLYIKRGTRMDPLIHGGGQERSRRAGTENSLTIGTLGEAARVLGPRIIEENKRLKILRDDLEAEILRLIPKSKINGSLSPRVSNTSNIFFEDIDGETLLINLDTKGFAVSSGAACSSGSQEPSPVLQAMGLTSEEASQSLRISLGWLTTDLDVQNFLKTLVSSIKQMRESRQQMMREEMEQEALL